MERNPERMDSMIKQFRALDLPYQRHVAIDGQKVSDDDFEAFAKARPRVRAVGKWTKGKMGCNLSHRGLWKIAAQSSDPYIAIFEDDAIISDEMKTALETSSWIPQDADIIRLESTAWMKCLLSKNPVQTLGERKLHKIRPNTHRNTFPMGAGAYILSRDAARKLIEAPLDVFVYTDRSLFDCASSSIAKSFNIYQVTPAYCIQDKFYHENEDDIVFKSNIEKGDESKEQLYVSGNKVKAFLRKYGSKIGLFQVFNFARRILYYLEGYRVVPFKL